MSLDALIGRVLMVAPPDRWLTGSQAWLDDLQPAGVILFRRHLPDEAEAARAAIARLQAWASARGEILLVAMDEEGGIVTQTSHFMPTPPSARALAWAANPPAVREVFTVYGRRLRALGMNLDLAPVCDVNNNPRNPVIGVRSFGSEPDQITEYARAVQEGLSRAGLLSCLKHFPGHGDTDLDSHLTLPVVSHDRARFDAVELRPFKALLDAAPAVMVAHLACPRLGDGELPATLSVRVTTHLLRDELGFPGVAVTDAMEMQGVAGAFDFDECAVRAMQAGCDLLLYSGELGRVEQAREGLRRGVDSGRLSTARLQEAAGRVDRLRVLAATRGDTPEAARALPALAADAGLYRDLCRAALRVENPDGWRAIARSTRDRGSLRLVGWNVGLLAELAGRLRGRGVRADTATPEEAVSAETAGVIVVLAERRPLGDEAIEPLRRLARRNPAAALANLLTPEVDAPVSELFAARLRTADSTSTMLDVVVDHWLDTGSS